MLWLTLVCFSLVRGDKEYEDPEEKPIEREAEFTSIPLKVLVNEGETIRLPCFVDRIEGYVLLWKFGETILSVGGRVIDSSRERRLLLEEETNGNYLVINNAVSKDGGNYICQISAYRPKDITHSVMVRTRPNVTVGVDVMTVTQGEGVTLQCNVVGGHPVPEVSWSRKEGTLPGGGDVVFDHNLEITNISSSDSGSYICRGDNGFSADHNATVQLVVEHPPDVEQSDLFIHSSQGGPVTVECKVLSHPPATVQWFSTDQEEPLSSPEYNISADLATNTHTLLVSTQPAGNSSLESEYSCVATNSLGSASKQVIISSRPGSPVITPSQGDQMDTFLLHWEVTSWLPVSSFLLELKGPELSRKVEVTDVEESGNSTWTGEYSAVGLAAGMQYQARVRGVSEHGEGPASNWLEFETLGAASGSARGRVTILIILSALLAHSVCTRTH
eukprot:GFUD01017266.1.p1 GENE.GFUD01017266.1~~GFUD01017266.1.p1  ORF type:complete len:445 (-),score=133.60 GFUD01017266.1:266-1600(-)